MAKDGSYSYYLTARGCLAVQDFMNRIKDEDDRAQALIGGAKFSEYAYVIEVSVRSCTCIKKKQSVFFCDILSGQNRYSRRLPRV